jgi:hypothetical protein
MAGVGVISPAPTSVFLSGTSQSDLIAVLPERAGDRLRALYRARDRARAAQPSGEDIRAARQEQIEAQQRLDRLLAHPQDGGFGQSPDDPRVLLQHRRAAELKEAADIAARDYEELGNETQTWLRMVASCESWIRSRPTGTAIVEVAEVETEVPRDLLGTIASLRKKAAAIEREIETIEAAPWPSDMAKAEARRQITALAAERGKPVITALLRNGGPIGWPEINAQVQIYNAQTRGVVGFTQISDPLLWLNVEALIAAIEVEIDNQARDDLAMTPSAKEKASAAAGESLLSVQRQICAAVWLGLSRKLPVAFADEAPAAILGVELQTLR